MKEMAKKKMRRKLHIGNDTCSWCVASTVCLIEWMNVCRTTSVAVALSPISYRFVTIWLLQMLFAVAVLFCLWPSGRIDYIGEESHLVSSPWNSNVNLSGVVDPKRRYLARKMSAVYEEKFSEKQVSYCSCCCVCWCVSCPQTSLYCLCRFIAVSMFKVQFWEYVTFNVSISLRYTWLIPPYLHVVSTIFIYLFLS